MRKAFAVFLLLSLSGFSAGVYTGNPSLYEKALKLQKEFDYVILNLKGLGVAQFPKYSTLHLINEVYLHPLFSKTVMFSGGWQVVSAKTSFKTVQFRIYKNALVIQPVFDFRGGSVDVLLRKGNEEMLVKLICFSVSQKGVFYPYSILVDRKILSPEVVFEKYFELFKKIPTKEVEIFINGITYFIKPVNC